MRLSRRHHIGLVLLCHFGAALAALGMPPFFGLILVEWLQHDASYLIGWFYIVPTLCTALANPWWGSFADRRGKKLSLLRAQLGLALGFLLAGFAGSPWFFLLALIVQGSLGGTFAASTAYLSTLVQGERLARCLNLMQGSARAAMVVAPVLFGFLINRVEPLRLYHYLLFLPLLAALALWLLPAPRQPATPSGAATGSGSAAPEESASEQTVAAKATPEKAEPEEAEPEPVPTGTLLFLVQFSFIFATVVTFPYFVPYAQEEAGLSIFWAGLLFSVPHLVYLLWAWPLSRWSSSSPALRVLSWGFGLLLLSVGWQGVEAAWPGLLLARTFMGVGMTLCFIGLHRMTSAAARTRRSGRLFGSLDSTSKWAGVAAGLCAGALSAPLGLQAPLWLGAFAAGLALVFMLTRNKAPASPQHRTSPLAKE